MVFTTKDRVPFLSTPELSREVFTHIRKNADQKGILLDCINGYQEHAHCLLSLGKEQTVSQVAHLLKSESSYRINKNKLTKNKFFWQDDYWAASISEATLRL